MKAVSMRAVLGMVALAAALSGCSTLSDLDTVVEPRNDAELGQLVSDRLSQDAVAARNQYRVSADAGIVTVTGLIPGEPERARVLGIVRGTPGVKGVVDQLERR